MAAEAEMGEIEEMHSKQDDGETILNGDIAGESNESEITQDAISKAPDETEDEPMEVEEENVADSDSENSAKEESDKDSENKDSDDDEEEKSENEEESAKEKTHNDELEDGGESEVTPSDNVSDSVDGKSDGKVEVSNGDKNDEIEVHEITDDDDEDDEDDAEIAEENLKNGLEKTLDETIELNDSGGEGDGDVMIIDDHSPKENGSVQKRAISNELEVIELDSTPVKKTKRKLKNLTPRRSVRNLNKQRSYVENDKDEDAPRTADDSSEESDIEEVTPQDPLAVNSDKIDMHRRHKASDSLSANSSTIVVKDTKRLVEIAAKSNTNSGNKKEPTLVIIDTNSILSGRGPVPANKQVNNPSSISSQAYPALLPMALPAQGMYPPNMRATITPIPVTSTPVKQPAQSPSLIPSTSATTMAPVLPTLTDDMFVVEAPSFIVPYVYEKPPVSEFKDFVKEMGQQIEKDRKEKKENEKKEKDKTEKKDDEGEEDDKDEDKDKQPEDKGESKQDEKMDTDEITKKFEDPMFNDILKGELADLDGDRKQYSYFESPLGKFFIDIGFNLVQEYVQSDLLRQQKRKRDREGGKNATTNSTIHSLVKNLEFSKENNEPFKIPMKKCDFCNFKTESMLAMAHHLETPHTKNYVYKCNFCPYEVRSPHDILFHMEAEHTVRGRLERAPAFHQCPNCPFEDNQKGKLSRHLVTCMRKFKPDKNLDPPIDWEPPAKIPRVPKQRQGLNVSAYQAMKTSQLQFLSKMHMMNTSNTTHPLHRGRGRPAMGPAMKGQQVLRPSGMVYKQTMGGGSVLVPTNYQLSGNQVYQVLGGQELSGRLGHPGHMAFVPNMPSASSTVTIQQQNQTKSKPMHQPSISITPLPRAASSSPSGGNITSKPGDTNSKNSFVICEICDGYIKDLEQLRNHMQWIHKVKIHPKMIYNRPPLNCQKCQFRFFTDQGLERHLLGSHGLVTSSMQDAANKSKDSGRCPVCGRVYQWKLLNHVARDHNMTLKPAHLSYKCTVCTATFGMYKQFENHVYSAHSVVAKRVMDKKNSSSSTSSSANKNDHMMKPLKINDEITIIPQPAKASAGPSKEGSPSSSATGSTNSRNSTPSTSKNADSTTLSNSSAGDKASSCTTNSAD